MCVPVSNNAAAAAASSAALVALLRHSWSAQRQGAAKWRQEITVRTVWFSSAEEKVQFSLLLQREDDNTEQHTQTNTSQTQAVCEQGN